MAAIARKNQLNSHFYACKIQERNKEPSLPVRSQDPGSSRSPQCWRVEAQPSTVRTASLRAAIIPRIIQAHLFWLGALEASKAAAHLLLHADTRAIALKTTGCIAVRIVDASESTWTSLELTSTATTADLDLVKYRLRCRARALGRGDCASSSSNRCWQGGFRRRIAGL